MGVLKKLKQTTLKTDKQVVENLETRIYNLLNHVEKLIKSNKKREATEELLEIHNLYEIRGYATNVDEIYVKVWEKYLEKFP